MRRSASRSAAAIVLLASGIGTGVGRANEPTHGTRVRIVDSGSFSIGGVFVRLWPSGTDAKAPPRHELVSGEDGFTMLPYAGAACWDTEARKEGYLPLRVAGVCNSAQPLEWRMFAAASIRIEVRAARTSSAVRGAELTLLAPERCESPPGEAESGPPIAKALTNAEGGAQLEELRPAALCLRVTAQGFVTQRVPLTLAPGHQQRLFLLDPAFDLRGQVTDSERNPIPGASVRFEPAVDLRTLLFRLPASSLAGRADEQGVFILRGLPRGWPGDLLVSAPGFAPARVAVVAGSTGEGAEDPSGQAAMRRVVLDRGRTLSGKVEDQEGPVVGATVTLEEDPERRAPIEDAGTLPGSVRSGPGGKFRIGGIPARDVVLLLDAPEHCPVAHVVRQESQEQGTETDVGTIRLERGAPLSGVVASSDGTPVPGAEVTVRGRRSSDPFQRRTLTGTDGGFHFRVPPEAELSLEVHAAGWAPLSATLESHDDQAILLTLYRPAALRGIAKDPEGRPVVPLRVELRGIDPAGGSFRTSLEQADPAGEFRVPDLSPGAYEVLVASPAHLPFRASGVALREEATTDLGQIELKTGRSLHGTTVARETERPVPGALVWLAEGDRERDPGFPIGHLGDAVVTDVEGSFWIGGLPRGACSLRVEHLDYAPLRVELPGVPPDSASAGDAEIRVSLSAGGAIEGEARSRRVASEPATDIVITVSSAMPLAADVRSDGTFRLERLPAGEYRLTWWRKPVVGIPSIVAQTAATVREGETAYVTFEDPDAKVAVQGRLRWRGDGMAGWSVMLAREGGESGVPAFATTSASGEFSLELSSAGACRAIFKSPTGASTIAKRVIVPDEGAPYLDIELGTADLAGRVRSDDGAAIPAAAVSVLPESGSDSEDVTKVHTDEGGQYAARYLLPGRYRVEASREGFLPGEPVQVDVADGGQATADLVLPRGCVLVLEAEDEWERPLEGATFEVQVEGRDPAGTIRGNLDAAGRASVRSLPSGRAHVSVRTADGRAAEKGVDLSPATVSSVRLRVPG